MILDAARREISRQASTKLDVYLSRMDEGDHKEAMWLLTTRREDDPRLFEYSGEFVARVLTVAGFPIGETAVKRYRRMLRQNEEV